MVYPVVIVTGASRGIGYSIAEYLLSTEKVNVITVSRSQGQIPFLATTHADKLRQVLGDVTSPDVAKQAVSLAINDFGRLDGVILNAGILEPVDQLADADLKGWQKIFNVNVFSIVSFIKAAIPELRKTKGRVVITSSGASTHYYSGWGAYGASKAAVNHIAGTLDYEEPDISSFSIAPGVVDTEMQGDIREKFKSGMSQSEHDNFIKLQKSGQLLPPEVPGRVIARLAIAGPKSLSGKYYRYNDPLLQDI